MRLLCVAAHPDDETIGAGALLARTGDVCIVHTTDGAPRDPRFRSLPDLSREEYSRLRRDELDRALEVARIEPGRAVCLGATDLEAHLEVSRLARELECFIVALAPDAIVTHPYEGGHPDHDATALAVHAACGLVVQSGERAPPLFEMTSYHGGPGRFVAQEFLHPNDAACIHGREGARVLTISERAQKRAMLACFASQARVLAPFTSFIERTRPAPSYVFSRAPHAGALWYERAGLPVTGLAWRERAVAALREMGLSVLRGAPDVEDAEHDEDPARDPLEPRR